MISLRRLPVPHPPVPHLPVPHLPVARLPVARLPVALLPVSWLLRLGVLGLALVSTACASTGRLAEYSFEDQTLAVVATTPPRPTIDTPEHRDVEGGGGLLGEVIRIGAELARDYEAWKAGPKLERAAEMADITGRLSDGVLERSAGVLRAEPVDRVQDADFELMVVVRDYGIDFSNWDGAARWFIQAEVTLNDADGARIWRTNVDERDDVREGTPTGAVGDILTARALADMTEEEMAEALRGLADYSAERIARKLRDGMEKARGG